MKKIILIALIVCLNSIVIWAQPRHKKVKAARVAYITEELKLTPDEATLFWPIYNQLLDEMKAVKRSYRNIKKVQPLTDQEAEKLLLDDLKKEEELTAIKREYYWRLKEVISPMRIIELKQIERDFKQMLLKHSKGKG